MKNEKWGKQVKRQKEKVIPQGKLRDAKNAKGKKDEADGRKAHCELQIPVSQMLIANS